MPCETNLRQQCQPDEEKNSERQSLALLTPALMGDPFAFAFVYMTRLRLRGCDRISWLEVDSRRPTIEPTNVAAALRSGFGNRGGGANPPGELQADLEEFAGRRD